MTGKTILTVALAAAACALGSLTLLYVFPEGNLDVNRWIILAGSTVSGLAACCMFHASARSRPGRLALFAPTLLLAACATIVVAAFLVPHPLARKIGRVAVADFPTDLAGQLRDFPHRPQPADFRALEWHMREAERSLELVAQSMTAAGFTQEKHLQWIEAELRNTFYASPPVMPARGLEVPAEKRQQYRRIAERLRKCADDLDRAARQTRLPTVIAWIEGVTMSVRQKICDPMV
jgi:hypothetical protein